MYTKKSFLSYLYLLVMMLVSTSVPDTQAFEKKSNDNYKQASTKDLIESLRKMLQEQYGINNLSDLATWGNDRSLPQKDAGEYEDYKDLLSVLFGFRPIGISDLMVGELRNQKRMIPNIPIIPSIREILQRKDSPIKFLSFCPTTFTIAYNTDKQNSERDAYIDAILTLETCPFGPFFVDKPSLPDNVVHYVQGTLYSYPENAIKRYILGSYNEQLQEQLWEEIKQKGDTWLKNYRAKTVEELKTRLDQLLSEKNLPETEIYP